MPHTGIMQEYATVDKIKRLKEQIASLTAAFITGIQSNPAVPQQVSAQASTQLASGVPFVSEGDLAKALDSLTQRATRLEQELDRLSGIDRTSVASGV